VSKDSFSFEDSFSHPLGNYWLVVVRSCGTVQRSSGNNGGRKLGRNDVARKLDIAQARAHTQTQASQMRGRGAGKGSG